MTTAALPEVAAAERMRRLERLLWESEGFGEAAAELAAGRPATFDGAWGSSCALLAAALKSPPNGDSADYIVAVLPAQREADEFTADLEFFSAERPLLYPAWERDPDEQVVQEESFGERLRTIKGLMAQGEGGHGCRLLVTSIQALLQPTTERSTLEAGTRRLAVGERIEIEPLLRWLTERGFHHTTAVELPGEFCHRGGILDIFAPDWYQPIRFELFDDEIESIRRFDVSSQRSLEKLTEANVTVVAAATSDRGHLADYLPANSWFLLMEPSKIQEEGRNYLQRVEKHEQFHSVAGVFSQCSRFAVATAGAILEGTAGHTCHLPIESVERFSGDIGKVKDELDRLGEGQEVFVVAQTEAEIERLKEILMTTRLAAAGRLSFPLGTLREGFRLRGKEWDAGQAGSLPHDGIVIITGGELFHRGELRRLPRRRLGKAIDSFLDLREGDLVVHLAHGIGRYRGLRLIEKQGQAEEHLEIEFDGGTKIFVPAVKIDLVQKYIGGSKTRPSLAKIGGKSWLKQKQAAEVAVRDLAVEMLDMQAIRASRPGITFGPDTDWQREFDRSFPYTETPDQLTAISAIKKDMQYPRPMDRLLCGDVGFGKTEVAMRAAFKAVDNGHQVAVLVPTTILAEQHFHSFRERMAEFPFDIAKLSRFCQPHEEREAIAGLKSGRVDIVIGTHRLASQDVQFANLGLVVIDEEQRFGVDVKERLKMLRATVDVLTLSATPIPRTLHMSLVGVRDISNLETPPEDRLAVETKVTRWNNDLVRHSILRELSRGGQIYFVHNRVNDIELLANKLRMIVPEARIRVGHAQMADDELEQVMIDFVDHKFDLLLATTIIESGLDIPNANTIFIDEADRYGLADLHQLRGRVGRYKNRAYCYLLIDPHKHITPNAARRLKAIEEFSEMGSGFAISMRDLEIRGAGNLLGTQQSGHIATVGYELYCQLLENAVRTLQKMAPKLSLEVDINLPGDAFLPADYVDDMRLKIDLYRRLTRVSSFDDLADFRSELVDRFGEPPPPTVRLLELAELKMEAVVWLITAIFIEQQYVVFRYSDRRRIEQLARMHKGRLRVVDDKSAYLPIPKGLTKPVEILSLVKSVLRPMK
ncbi:MAG: transcription-repair coupling factor [Planctomycetales bacterium]|nr:transcription-repair coupling factor [Planctomycetales bacterium]